MLSNLLELTVCLQNGAVESYNGKLAVCIQTLLFGLGLPAKYWSSALIHSVYLHNWLVHTVMRKTLFEAYFGVKPDLSCLKPFGLRVCVKHSGYCRSKLDRHDFKGIFLGYTVTDQNIINLDLDSGVVKLSHHAQFDEAWYLQSSHPPAAQFLYDLGLLPEEDPLQDPASVDNALSVRHIPLRALCHWLWFHGLPWLLQMSAQRNGQPLLAVGTYTCHSAHLPRITIARQQLAPLGSSHSLTAIWLRNWWRTLKSVCKICL
jgi:hypothetical protein